MFSLRYITVAVLRICVIFCCVGSAMAQEGPFIDGRAYSGISLGKGYGSALKLRGGFVTPEDRSTLQQGAASPQNEIDDGLVPSRTAEHSNGIIGAYNIGYDMRMKNLPLRLGAEADFSFGQISDKATTVTREFSASGSHGWSTFGSTDTDWISTFRGRLAYPLSNAFSVFMSGGVAVGNIEVALAGTSMRLCDRCTIRPNTSSYDVSSRSTKTLIGWTAGSGFEVALNRTMSLKSEFLYYDLGSVTTTAIDGSIAYASPSAPIPALQAEAQARGYLLRTGLNFNFNAF